MADRFDVGDIIKMKKPHPCGTQEWEILRVGADFRLKMYGLRAPDHGAKKIGRKKYKTNYKKGLKQQILYGIIRNCDMLMEQFQSVIQFPCSREEPGAKRP